MKVSNFKTFLLCSIIPFSSGAQDYTPINEDERMHLSVAMLNNVNYAISEVSLEQKDCNDKIEIKGQSEKEKIECICDLDSLSEEKRSAIEAYLGEIKSRTLVVDTGNDNLLHGIGQLYDGWKKHDGDDRGRTFGINSSYEVVGTDAKLKLLFDSTGFSRFERVDGQRKDAKGNYYLQFREYNALEFDLEKYIKKDENNKTTIGGQIGYYYETDNGSISRPIQNQWHRSNKHLDMIQYNYVEREKSKHTLSVLGALGKEYYTDIGNWKCATSVNLKLGFSVDSNHDTHMEARFRTEAKVSHSRVASWLALSTYLEASDGHRGEEFTGGVKLSSDIKFKGYTISPYIGAEKTWSARDRKYSTDARAKGDHDIYYKLGVTLRF